MTSQAFLWINLGFASVLGGLFLFGRWKAQKPARLHLRGDKINSSYSEVRNLNAIFMYNGESWDAYEVLGLPAGAGRDLVEEAYRSALKCNSSQTHSFLDAAYHCIISASDPVSRDSRARARLGGT